MPAIRVARDTDRAELIRMRMTFWPDSTADEVSARLQVPPSEGVTLVAERSGGGLEGFAEVDLRQWAEGCTSTPVPYLEGIWVDGDRRRTGVATALVEAVAEWAMGMGFIELASDCELSNLPSQAFHRSTGFAEVQRNVSFRRDLKE